MRGWRTKCDARCHAHHVTIRSHKASHVRSMPCDRQTAQKAPPTTIMCNQMCEVNAVKCLAMQIHHHFRLNHWYRICEGRHQAHRRRCREGLGSGTPSRSRRRCLCHCLRRSHGQMRHGSPARNRLLGQGAYSPPLQESRTQFRQKRVEASIVIIKYSKRAPC